MASVQVRILQSGRTDAYGLPLIPGSVVTVDRDYAVSLIYAGFASWMNPADAYDGETNLRKPSETYTVFQSGIPFVIFAGDGGSNGFAFTGTRAVFSLSAAVITNFWKLLEFGGYAYIPAGAGGLATGGWYWCKMTSDTAGEIFAETYPGAGKPVFVGSPTALPNCSVGRIPQLTTSITAFSFTLPGGSMGPNGHFTTSVLRAGDTSATSKVLLVSIGGQNVVGHGTTTTPVGESLFLTRNMGSESAQMSSRSLGVGGFGGTIASQQYSTANTAVDNTVSVQMSVAANTASHLICGFDCSVKYGA